MNSHQPLLTVENLGCYRSGHWLWRDVTFTLNAGDCLGLVAPSGAGKTLLLRNLVLLDPIDQGQVTFAGRALADWALPAYRAEVIYLPQWAMAFEGTVQVNLEQVFTLSAHRHRCYNPAQIETWLGQLGRSPDFLALQAPQLSGGEAQILALLRALQLDPKVLLLDEPTASLDPDTTAQVEALLHRWRQQGGRASIVTSHDPAQIERFTTRQLHLKEFI
ncbi:MAG: ATP-binding cassette domain-containing protein [Nodosilinea sp.]